MTKQSTAVYFAKEAYSLWIMRGTKTAGFNVLESGGYLYTGKGAGAHRIYLKDNGAFDATRTKENKA